MRLVFVLKSRAEIKHVHFDPYEPGIPKGSTGATPEYSTYHNGRNTNHSHSR